MSLFTDPTFQTMIPQTSHNPHMGTTDPMSIWEEVERPNPANRPETPSGKQQPPTSPPKPEKKG